MEGVEGLGRQILVTTTMVRARDASVSTGPAPGIINAGPASHLWPMTSADKLTLEAGYALDTVHVYEMRLDEVRVKEGLARLLGEYLTFAGRYDRAQGGVILNDTGVPFTTAHDPDWDVAKILAHQHDLEPGRFVDYSSNIFSLRLGSAPLMRVKLTHLRDGGSALGVCATHGICDGETFYTMLDRWSRYCRSNVTDKSKPSVPPSLDQSQIPYAPGRRSKAQTLESMADAGWSKIDVIPAAARLADVLFNDGLMLHNFERTRPFVLSQAGLARMKLAAELEAKARRGTPFVTSNEALSSFLCQLMARLFEYDDAEPCSHSTMLNWRGRFPGLAANFAGNASSAIKTCDFHAGTSLGIITASMHEGLEPLKGGDTLVEHVNLFLDVHDNGIAAHMADPATLPYLSRSPTTFVTNNFARYPIYDADFGQGRPVAVVPHHCGDQIVIWPMPHDEGVALFFQGSTAIRIKNLPDDSTFFRELFKFEREIVTDDQIREFFRVRGFASDASLPNEDEDHDLASPKKRGRKQFAETTAAATSILMPLSPILVGPFMPTPSSSSSSSSPSSLLRRAVSLIA